MASKEAEVADSLRRARDSLALAFKAFHELLVLKTLDANKTDPMRIKEQSVVDKLINEANDLDAVNNGEGTLTLITIMCKELMTLRDRINEVDYQVCRTQKVVSGIKQAKDGEKK